VVTASFGVFPASAIEINGAHVRADLQLLPLRVDYLFIGEAVGFGRTQIVLSKKL